MEYRDLSLESIVFEARYNQSFGYLDKSNEIINKIDEEIDGLHVLDNLANAPGFRLTYKQENIVFNFGPASFNISRANTKDSDFEFFITYLKSVFRIVSECLDLNEYSRIGLRYWFVYPVGSAEEGREVLSESGIFNENKKVETLFGKKLKDKSIVVVLEEAQKGHRISLAMAKKEEVEVKIDSSGKVLSQTKRKDSSAEMAILLDLDNYADKPKEKSLDGFIDETVELCKNNIIKLIGGD
jgi:uncharacterized protein (TIGR04255 family)